MPYHLIRKFRIILRIIILIIYYYQIYFYWFLIFLLIFGCNRLFAVGIHSNKGTELCRNKKVCLKGSKEKPRLKLFKMDWSGRGSN
jgi:hypothetical protein